MYIKKKVPIMAGINKIGPNQAVRVIATVIRRTGAEK